MTQERPDIAIVGGGIIGMSMAWEFLRRNSGLRIALIAPKSDSGAASRASGAMLSGFGETTQYSFASAAGRAKMLLRMEAARKWAQWAADLSEASGTSIPVTTGTVVLTNSVSGPLDEWNLDAMIKWLLEQNEPHESIDPLKELGLRPSIPERPARAIFLPRECCVESSVVLDTLARMLSASPRVDWVNDKCLEVQPLKESKRYKLVCKDQEIQAGTVILACGVDTLQLINRQAELVATIPPIFAGAGTALVCQAAEETRPLLRYAMRTPNRAFACGLHVLPMRKGVYIGATNNVQLQPAVSPILSDLAFLMECAVHQIDRRLTGYTLSAIRVGNRPVVADTFPLLGETRLPGLWLATGTYRDGFLMAPLLSERLFDAVIAGRSTLAGAEMFKPERLPLESADRESAIQEAVEYYVAIAFERRSRLPPVGAWEEGFREEVERRMRQIYSTIGNRFVLPPDFTWEIEHGDITAALKQYYETASAYAPL